MIKAIIFDYYRTLYNPEEKEVSKETFQLLQRLKEKGLRLALISKKEQGREKEIKVSPFFSFFSFVCFCEEKKVTDLETACRVLKVSKEEAIVVGDREKKEITVGNQAGIKTVWLKKGKFAEEVPTKDTDTPTYVITQLNEVEKVIENLNT